MALGPACTSEVDEVGLRSLQGRAIGTCCARFFMTGFMGGGSCQADRLVAEGTAVKPFLILVGFSLGKNWKKRPNYMKR